MDYTQPTVYDRTSEDISNLVEFGHVNIGIDDQRTATLFYVMGLGLTRDPYINVGVDNMWINIGTCQFHLPIGRPQVLRGTIGTVIPDLGALMARLEEVRPRLDGTKFTFQAHDTHVDVTCPWGNHIRCHAPDRDRFGPITLGMPYVEIDTAIGTVEGIARFYMEYLGASASVDGQSCRVSTGSGETLIYRETATELPPFDGHHIQITLANFSGPHRRLRERGLITEESSAHQYRFQSLIDPNNNNPLAVIEHEVRSVRHPMYARRLINRNPSQTAMHYAGDRENWIQSLL